MPLILVKDISVLKHLLDCGLTHISNYQDHNFDKANEEASSILNQLGLTVLTDREKAAMLKALEERS
jgi:hypothetical protein